MQEFKDGLSAKNGLSYSYKIFFTVDMALKLVFHIIFENSRNFRRFSLNFWQ